VYDTSLKKLLHLLFAHIESIIAILQLNEFCGICFSSQPYSLCCILLR